MARRGDLTRAAVLALLGREGPRSRAQLSRSLGLSAAALSSIVRDLLDRGLVEESAQAPSNGGRPAILLSLAGNPLCALGVKVSPDRITWRWTALDGSELTSGSERFDPAAPAAAHRLAESLAGVLAAGEMDMPPVIGIGIAVPGQVPNRDTGVVTAPTIGWSAVPLGMTLGSRLRLPVLVENDVNALGAAELLYGLGASHENFLIITIGAGIGMAVVSDGQVYRGAHGGAGEIGHVPVAIDGPPCTCGNNGCLESLIGAAALNGRWARDPAAEARHGDLRVAADAGDAPARALFHAAGLQLGRTVAGLVNVLDPEVIAVLGEGTVAWPHWAAGFDTALRAGVFPARRDIHVDVQDWDDSSWALGAAALVLASPHDASIGPQGEAVRARLTDVTLAGSVT